MIIKRLEDIAGTERDVAWGNGQSRRLLLAKDGMGYTVTDTLIDAGSESYLQYRNHLEACYVIEGEGAIVEESGAEHPLRPGTLYALDGHDAHRLRAHTAMRLVCVFTPPLAGPETHQLGSGGASAY